MYKTIAEAEMVTVKVEGLLYGISAPVCTSGVLPSPQNSSLTTCPCKPFCGRQNISCSTFRNLILTFNTCFPLLHSSIFQEWVGKVRVFSQSLTLAFSIGFDYVLRLEGVIPEKGNTKALHNMQYTAREHLKKWLCNITHVLCHLSLTMISTAASPLLFSRQL